LLVHPAATCIKSAKTRAMLTRIFTPKYPDMTTYKLTNTTITIIPHALKHPKYILYLSTNHHSFFLLAYQDQFPSLLETHEEAE
jgi:hypothetical protein